MKNNQLVVMGSGKALILDKEGITLVSEMTKHV